MAGTSKPEDEPCMQLIHWVFVIGLMVYLLLVGWLVVDQLANCWPGSQPCVSDAVPAGSPEADWTKCTIGILGMDFAFSEERRLLILVIFAGALGGLLHGLRSLLWYAGNQAFGLSWTLLYLLRPLVSMCLAAVVYLVVRGGLFADGLGGTEVNQVQATNPFGFMAVAALVGLFTEPAILKLKKAAEAFFTKPPEGQDSRPQDADGG